MPPNIDLFNRLVVLLFDDLYRRFPQPATLSAREYAGRLDIPVEKDGKPIPLKIPDIDSHFSSFMDATLTALQADGLIRQGGRGAGSDGYTWNYHGIVLTLKALGIMNAVPESLEGEQRTVGEAVADIAKDVGGDAKKAAIGKLVGEVIGGAMKAFSEG